MYRKVLSTVNERLNSEVAARYALRLSRELGAKLFFCFVAEKGISQQNRRAAEDAMKRLFNAAMDLNVQAESIAEIGDPVTEIGKIVRHEGISLAFVATRREDIERRFYAGTTARRLSLRLPCSVALVRIVHAGRVHPKRILVPLKARIDRVDERASFVTHMAHAFNSKIFVFHAPKPVAKFFHGEVHLTPPEWEERMSPDISHFMKYLERHDIEHEGRLLPGKTGRNITIEAFAKRHDLIIMGASERNLLASLFRGNPVEEVLREAPCDLIILKPRHED
jgi:nucleotide-binding universal stress UspA family protein